MPADYIIDTAARLVRSRGWGRLTFTELKKHQDRLRADPAFDPTFDQLLDFREVEAIMVTADELRVMAAPHIFVAGARRAVLHLPDRPVIRGLVHMFEAFRESAGGHERIATFDDLDAALRWLEEPRRAPDDPPARG